MSGSPAGAPNQSFHDRLNRVAEHRTPMDAEKPEVDVLPDWKDTMGGPFGLILAVIVGLIAVFLARLALFHASGSALVGKNADLTMAVETGAAIALSFVIFLALPYTGAIFRLAQVAGVLIMIPLMHNAVHTAPGLFGAMFSPEWAEEVTSVTDPGSFYLRGEVIPFTAPEEAEEVEEEIKPLPPILRVG